NHTQPAGSAEPEATPAQQYLLSTQPRSLARRACLAVPPWPGLRLWQLVSARGLMQSRHSPAQRCRLLQTQEPQATKEHQEQRQGQKTARPRPRFAECPLRAPQASALQAPKSLAIASRRTTAKLCSLGA